MKQRSILAVLFLTALCCTFVSALAQDKSKAPGPGMGNADMDAMMKASMPGEPQKSLARLAGDWSFTSTAWMAPGQPPMTSNGTMHGVVLMGGRYVEHTWKGTFMGMPFEGRGTDGYDNVAKHYVSSWVDTMGTGILYQVGHCDDAVKVCNYSGDVWDPMTGKKTLFRSVITWADNDNFKNEMYGNGPDGKEMKMMELSAKRK
ncbi:MAG: DUF1579 domain-containing protein [Thermoanaerobaculia bacterium]